MDQKTRDLMALHAMALMNTPSDPNERKLRMDEYRAHERKCYDLYGVSDTIDAMMHGVGHSP